MNFNRSSGVLMNISSLPGKYGIGVFSKEAEEFADFILSGGFHYWQVLPITAIGLGNSPYSSVSAFAGNYLYIDADDLAARGLVSKEDADNTAYSGSKYTVDYAREYGVRRGIMKKAFEIGRIKYVQEIEKFARDNRWLGEYAEYMTVKEINGGKPWWEWDSSLKNRDREAVAEVIGENADTYEYYLFEQYIFEAQWKTLKEKLNKKGASIIGDMPIYVSHDSADVWANQKMFLLDEDSMPSGVAGVPPDYFSEDGQLWGNPLYDNEYMKSSGYAWWIERFDRMFDLYDALRIDHFRAFDRYWSVPRGSKTAKEGEWKEGIGRELFDIVKEKFKDAKIIAEDLGIIDDGVRELLAYTGFPGMRVMQFGFSDGDSIHLPHNFPINSIAYTATHDNNTTFGWLYELNEDIRSYTMRYVGLDPRDWSEGGYRSKSVHAVIRKLIESSAVLAIAPYQDLCGYGRDTRMNIPGVAEENWRFRTTEDCMREVDMRYYLEMNNLYGRNRK